MPSYLPFPRGSAAHTVSYMSLMRWWQARKSNAPSSKEAAALVRPRKTAGHTTLPLISPRRGRRILRREQLFSVVRESLIRAGVLSTSYEFKVLTLDATGDSFLVLVDLSLSAEAMPDEYLLEIERWIQQSAKTRHEMEIRSVYWRRKAAPDQAGGVLKAAVAARTRVEAAVPAPLATSKPVPLPSATAIPRPEIRLTREPAQAVGEDEVKAFRTALQSSGAMPLSHRQAADGDGRVPVPESHSDFAALSETQYGRF